MPDMSEAVSARMNTDEFMVWAMRQPEGRHYELVDGEVVVMSPERSGHGITKMEVASKLLVAIRAKGLPCDVYTDKMTIRISEHTAYEPDIVVRCGKRLDDDVLVTDDPLVIIEVLSPSTQSRDTTIKLQDYFRLPSLKHYIILNTRRRTATHYTRDDSGTLAASIDGGVVLRLISPDIEITDLFETRE